MIEGLHHIGIAVRSIDEALPRWVGELGLRLAGIEAVPSEGVRVAVLMAGTTRIELLEPAGADSPVARFLDKRGPGVHHLAFEVASADEAARVLTDSGAPVLGDAPRPGAHGTRVVFLHPRHCGGVLTELVEDADE